VLLGVGASEEMLMLSFLESRCEGAGRLSATDNDYERNNEENNRRIKKIDGGIYDNSFTCKSFYGFLTNHDEPSACNLPNPYTHRTCKIAAQR
jgi:hypothetical protein